MPKGEAPGSGDPSRLQGCLGVHSPAPAFYSCSLCKTPVFSPESLRRGEAECVLELEAKGGCACPEGMPVVPRDTVTQLPRPAASPGAAVPPVPGCSHTDQVRESPAEGSCGCHCPCGCRCPCGCHCPCSRARALSSPNNGRGKATRSRCPGGRDERSHCPPGHEIGAAPFFAAEGWDVAKGRAPHHAAPHPEEG